LWVELEVDSQPSAKRDCRCEDERYISSSESTSPRGCRTIACLSLGICLTKPDCQLEEDERKEGRSVPVAKNGSGAVVRNNSWPKRSVSEAEAMCAGSGSSEKQQQRRERERKGTGAKGAKGLGKCVGCTVQLGKAVSFLGIQQLERDYL
jgi:hypothetical protein